MAGNEHLPFSEWNALATSWDEVRIETLACFARVPTKDLVLQYSANSRLKRWGPGNVSARRSSG